MGKTFTPTYRVEYVDNTSARGIPLSPFSSMTWDCRRNGRPTVANLEKWRKAYNESFLPGRVNGHVSDAAGVIVHIFRARIVRQLTGAVVAETRAPAFEVVA